jgi:two-component system NtrC family sensor kinase
MKKYGCLFFLFLIAKMAFSQPTISPSLADSLKLELKKAKEDTAKVLILEKLTRCYTTIDLNIALKYGREGRALAERIGYMPGKLLCTISLGFILARTNDHAEGLQLLMEAKQYCERNDKPEELSRVLSNISTIYTLNKDYEKALDYAGKALRIQEKYHISESVHPVSLGLGTAYRDMGKYDSAIVYLKKAYAVGLKNKIPAYITSSTYYLGTVYAKLGQTDQAFDYYRKSISYSNQLKTNYTISRAYQGLAKLFNSLGQEDSTIFYCKKALEEKETNAYYLKTVMEASTLLAEIYEKHRKPNEALAYYKMATAARDTLFAQEKTRQIDKLAYEEQEREARTQRRLEAHKQDFENKIKIYALMLILSGVLIFAFFLYRNNRQKHKANALLHRQKEEIHLQREKAEKALSELKATQNQLIQAEKLASLGELTAGIAHEIQNPLNFVNNFSELSVELISELMEERSKEEGKRDKELENELLGDLSQNQEKINYHGKRASSIVKGMLEHSRNDVGVAELTDINQLADEFLRLSYHGLRAKNRSGSAAQFNADYELIADENLPKIKVIPQDIGRVLLNLINNAFYAVNERLKKQEAGYRPKVTVTTQVAGKQIELKIQDNGTGMPEATKAKIFQPFFTTKPTGEGTGLGLSLTYDIVTKGHGGTIEVETKEGEGTVFTVKLPLGL